jgi:hypothetical protein
MNRWGRTMKHDVEGSRRGKDRCRGWKSMFWVRVDDGP